MIAAKSSETLDLAPASPDCASIWMVTWGSKPIELKVRLRLSFRQWSHAVEAGKLPEVRAWLADAETALTKAIRCTERDMFAQCDRFAAIGSAWKEVTR